MRDIGKCRGQRKDNGELVYGSLFQCKYSKKAYIVLNEYSADELMQHKLFYSRFAWHEVIPETVGQCTGLKDKNGVESFFGDLIKIHDQIFEIKWDEKMGRVFLYGDGIDEDEILYLYGSDIINGEVVGNIHEGKK